jgi:FkbM family methyltransferase
MLVNFVRVTIKGAVKRILPNRLRSSISRALYPYRQGNRFFTPYIVRNKAMEGEVFDLLIGDRTGRDWYDRPCINNPRWLEMRFVRDHVIATGDVILECGSHHGCSTILLSKWVGETGKVVAFEPSPQSFRILEKNITLNGLTNVIARRECTGAADGSLCFDVASDAVGVSGKGVDVPVVRLDDYADLKPTFLKIDVEGFEMQVLEGAKGILATHPKIALELHAEFLPKFNASVDGILSLLDVDKYNVWIQRADDIEPVPYDRSPIESRCHLFFLHWRFPSET